MSEEPKIYQPDAHLWESKRPDYEMHDSEEDFRCWPNLAPILQDCQAAIGTAYCAADSAAMRHQFRHKRLVLIAAVCGMLAVLLALMQLSLDPLQMPLFGAGLVGAGEIVAAVVAVVAVTFGLLAAFSRKWLLERERAERYRLVKFRFLLTPKLWSGSTSTSEKRQKLLRVQVQRVEALDEKAVESWARGKGDVLEATASEEASAGVDEVMLMELIDYYQKKRLNYQQQYYEHQARRHNFWERHTRRVPYLLFFLSILAALGHFVYNLWTDTHGEPASIALVVLAASFPVVGVAVRNLRAAHEFGRNTLRFEATSNELKRLASDLREKSTRQMKLEVLHHIENVLEAERREWLRLMKEVEWFG